MIDSKFLIRYTNGLYTTDKSDAPSYEEFRDMFSYGQLGSKEWAVNKLASLNILSTETVVIVGAWYGTLGLLINKKFPDAKIKLLDIDARCEKYLQNITYDLPNVSAITGDMYDYKYTEYLVINTSCEHIPDIRAWLSKIPPGTTVMLQSNNFFNATGHVNCVSRLEEFEMQAFLPTLLFSGKFETDMYTRFMIIGKT